MKHDGLPSEKLFDILESIGNDKQTTTNLWHHWEKTQSKKEGKNQEPKQLSTTTDP